MGKKKELDAVIIGIDVGLTGGISISENRKDLPIVLKIPLIQIIVNKKNKKVYDMISIVKILEKYKERNVLFFIEKQGVRPREGSVSAMTIGKGFGQLLGVAYAFKFKIIEVTPQSWKKHFPELITTDMLEIKDFIKKMKVAYKILKDKEQKRAKEKEIDKLGRQFKKQAKAQSRSLASELFPELSDMFQKTNSDGLAESLLILCFGTETQSKPTGE